MGAADVSSIVDKWRADFVSSMKYGDTCVFHMDKVAPDFLGKYNSDMFPVPTIFCKEDITRDEIYKKMQGLMDESGSYVFLTHEVVGLIHKDSIDPGLKPNGEPLLPLFKPA